MKYPQIRTLKMVPLDRMNTLSDWLATQLETRGWSQRELSRRSGISPTQISDIISGKANPGADSSIAIARALGEPPEKLLRLAGILPALPPAVPEEREALAILRTLGAQARAYALAILRALRGDRPPPPANVIAEPRQPYTVGEHLAADLARQLDQLTPADQRRVIDLMRRLSGDTQPNGDPQPEQ